MVWADHAAAALGFDIHRYTTAATGAELRFRSLHHRDAIAHANAEGKAARQVLDLRSRSADPHGAAILLVTRAVNLAVLSVAAEAPSEELQIQGRYAIEHSADGLSQHRTISPASRLHSKVEDRRRSFPELR
jgi:hypothetical protein